MGVVIENEINEVEGDDERQIEVGRKAVLDKYFPPREGQSTSSGFADPAVLFGKRSK